MSSDATDKPASGEAVAAGSPERFGFEWQTYSELRQEYEDQSGAIAASSMSAAAWGATVTGQ
jgi:hypothetical protein